MVDFHKRLVEEAQELLDSGWWVPGVEPWGVAVLGIDPRSAAEIMTAEIMPGERTWHGLVPAGTNLNAGPAASQIFSAAVMREQVDP